MLGEIVEDRYLIEEELGAGAMGRVFRARHVRVKNQVAIKVIHAELLAHPGIIARFEREARIAARLSHPNVVGVLDVGVASDGRQLMVLELARGRRLAEYVTAPIERAHVIDLTRQILRGLAHAHAMGLVHRDLKPDNILVDTTADGEPIARIVDFGIAVLRDRGDEARLTEANMIVGTPQYMSPEHATGREIDARTDLFALGVIVYEMLAGCLPFTGTGSEVAFANVSQDPPSIAARAPLVDVDPLLEAFARKLMARRIDARFQSAREALAMLDLIETDRIAAARALCTTSTAPQVIAYVPLLPVASDTLPTQRVTTMTTMVRARRVPAWSVLAAAAAIVIAVLAWL